jgi:hypothetical protein
MLGSANRLIAPATDVRDVNRRERKVWWGWYSVCIAGTLLAAMLASSGARRLFPAALVVLCIVLVTAILRPATGVYLVVILTVLGDPQTWPWYPFTKNFSSAESILYVNNQLIINPLELCLFALAVGWLLQMMSRRQVRVQKGHLFWPLMIFTAFLFFGLFNGLSKGGDQNAALWELRPLVVLPVLYILITNLFDRREQYRRLIWLVMIGTFINALVALLYQRGLSAEQSDAVDSLVAHGATLPMNAMLVLIAAAWMLRPTSQSLRVVLPIMAGPVVFVYLVSERRAAVVALLAGFGLLAIFLFWTNRRAFLRIVPIVALLASMYTAVFWNDSTSMAGFPAQAIKSVIAPDSVSERNQSSDNYRVLEKIDVLATIQSSPYTGIGFGKPFLRPVPLPNIAPFLLEPYMTHNSILWVWMKVGIGGFVAMLFLFGAAMRSGAKAGLRLMTGDDAAMTVTAAAFVLMYAVFAYVDILWDPQNVLVLAVAMAQISSVLRPERREDPVDTPDELDARHADQTVTALRPAVRV